VIKFNKPINLNGAELLQELNNAGVVISRPPLIDGNGDFWLDVLEEDEAVAANIVETHNGTTVAQEPAIQDKLIAAGLTIDELKQALGLS
jgi:hypothetical protein